MLPSPQLPNSSFWLELGFQALVAVLFTAIAVSVRYAAGPRVTRALVGGMILLLFVNGALALNGRLSFDSSPPPVMLSVFVSMLLTLYVGFSRIGRELAETLSFSKLIGYQVFRFPLELLMHRAHVEGVMPVQMSFMGYNYDILTGITALAVALAYKQGRVSRAGLWAWNLLGLGLLVNVVTIAILSMPTPLRVFTNDPPNVWIAYWPFVWLPTFLVPAALLGHILVFRKLLRTSSSPVPHGRPA